MGATEKIAVIVVVEACVDVPCNEIKTTEVITNAFIQQHLKGRIENVDVKNYIIELKKANCCTNYANAENYSGWYDHHCNYFKHAIGVEHYDCEGFKEK